MSADQPPHHVLVAGGGVAALETVLALRALAGERVDVTLLAPERHFTYRPLAVGAPFGDAACVRYELAAVAAAVGATVVRDAVDAVEADAWRVHTQDGRTLGYDSLVLALGARADVAIPGALCFRGPRDVQRTATAIAGLRHAASPHVAFVVPPGSAWTLPMYELALLTGTWARREGLDVGLTLVTPEPVPLAAFGASVSDAVARLLAERRIAVYAGAYAETVEDGRLWLSLEGSMRADLAIALPALTGPGIGGVPADRDGFVPVDAFGRVEALLDVHAVGDAAAHPVKQGGLATQQADAAASLIAARAGAPVDPEPYRPVLRALLLTGELPLWLRHEDEPEALAAEADVISDDGPLWWPPHKIAGRHLAPWLAAHPQLAAATAVRLPAAV